MDQDSHTGAASKVPMLKPGQFELYRMRIEQYIWMIDHVLWEVIENGNTAPKTTVVEGVEKVMPPTTAEEKAQKRLEVKARSTLMMGIPNEHQLMFNSIKDAKLLMEAVEKRFGGNAATKKTKRNLLKPQYENFTAPSSEMLNQTFNRLQKLVSQLELLGETISQEDVNQKLLRSLSPEWNTHVVVWRNKTDLDTMSMDDLLTNKLRFLKNTGMMLTINGNESIGFDSPKLECYILPQKRTFANQCISDQAEEGPNYALMAYSSSSSDSEDKLENASKSLKRLTPATTTTPTTSVTDEQLKRLIDQGVSDALAACDTDKSRNGEDNHDSGTGVRRQAPIARKCTYPDFMKCKPLYIKGTEGVVELTQWFERMETVFRISNYIVENQIKFATCTLLGSAQTLWNSHVKNIGHDVAYAMTWTNLKKKMTDKYCPRGDIKKSEVEMWNLKVKESDKIERYIGGLPDMIRGIVMASKPKNMQDAIEFATKLMDKKIQTFAER
ncbi:ribonuclease H-like domain-containing protein [Tanacetum coccineum]|uniref:Ribonuclease H-like domain-containing protein n=1 Tax=Tanacetum coccineum TaxID=301880 RepID=A0ABQ5F7Z1_9ASTR